MIRIDCDYKTKDDIGFIIEAEKTNVLELSEKTGISRTTLENILAGGNTRNDVREKFYAYIYERGYRINAAKEELCKETIGKVLFHGSKDGLASVSIQQSRTNCDFGSAFYLGETYTQALSFVCDRDSSSVYSFKYSMDGLKVKEFSCNLDWMLAICHYRGGLRHFDSSSMVQKVVEDVEKADVIIAPIADNRMFYIMSRFIDGEINADIALHSLSASQLGKQYVFRTEKALDRLQPIERLYLSEPERQDRLRQLQLRSCEIDTKLKLASREYKNGLYIEELLK